MLYGTRPVKPPPLLLTALLLAATSTGCVTAYQPLLSLQRPMAIDPDVANFEGQKVLVRCIPGDYLEEDESQQLCRQVRTLFVNQSATVEVEVPRKNAGPTERTFKPDLIIELRARLISESNNFFSWVLCIGSFTLIPSLFELEFAQDVAVRDATGFLLASDSLQARIVRQFGLGVWGVNGLLDLIVRPKSEKVTGTWAKDALSKDLFGHISELAFHARMRAAVMNDFEAPRAAPAAGAPKVKAP